jgi:hypothetical protein
MFFCYNVMIILPLKTKKETKPFGEGLVFFFLSKQLIYGHTLRRERKVT